MLTGFARRFNSLRLARAGYHAGLASFLLLLGAGSVHDATALNETRTLSFHHTHSDEDITVTFKRNGRYDEEALKQLNHYLRDWRSQDQTVMDRHLFDILWEVYRDVDAKKPIQIISSYRSPATNAMLRRRSSGVARYSQHMLGHAMDFYIPDVALEQIRNAGLRLQRGGVGFYPTSGSPFVHLDTGSVRHWPRMTHDQLVRVFPNERTVHIPSDGTPLKGFELARADIERRGGGDDAAPASKLNLFARLFRGKSSDEDEESTSVAAVNAGTQTTASSKSADIKSAEAVPTPRAKPRVATTIQLASADTQIIQSAKSRGPADKGETKPQTPADIINARGFWDDVPATPKQATPAQVAAIRAREALAAADPQPTSSVAAAFQALAFAPAAATAPAANRSSTNDRTNVVAASAPVPRSARPAPARNAAEVNMVVAKGPQDGAQGQAGLIATSTRIAAATGSNVWMRVMMLAPSATMSMHTTVLGDPDLTLMRSYFVKPQAVVAMSFSDDPLMGLVCDHFTGSATARLEMTSLVLRTASLR